MSLVNSKVAKNSATRFALLCALLFLLIANSTAVYAQFSYIVSHTNAPVVIRGVNYGTVVVNTWPDGSITATFVPNPSYTLQQVADAIGALYGIPPGTATLNWLQICAVDQGGFTPIDGYGQVQHPPYVDPPAGGYAPFWGNGEWDDTNPYYYNTYGLMVRVSPKHMIQSL